jgi:hypothetical protein
MASTGKPFGDQTVILDQARFGFSGTEIMILPANCDDGLPAVAVPAVGGRCGASDRAGHGASFRQSFFGMYRNNSVISGRTAEHRQVRNFAFDNRLS